VDEHSIMKKISCDTEKNLALHNSFWNNFAIETLLTSGFQRFLRCLLHPPPLVWIQRKPLGLRFFLSLRIFIASVFDTQRRFLIECAAFR